MRIRGRTVFLFPVSCSLFPRLCSLFPVPFSLFPCFLFAFIACRPTPSAQSGPARSSTEFQNPQRITIDGYNDDAMEPFLTRDGKYLFFNNLNEPNVNTNLHWAERIDDLHFKYRGEIQGVNTPALEGVASMDRQSNFYFVSNRSYDQTASTLYRGHFANGALTNVELVPGVSLAKPGIVNFDAEISADGNTLYFVESQFSILGQPKSAHILFARRNGNTFVRDDSSASIFQSINPAGLNYAPATSASECELFFTRADTSGPAIYMSKRANKSQPFDPPLRIAAITGFAEGPTLSPDELSLYYHLKQNGRFQIYRVTRPPQSKPSN
jgi:Tol biopolymer transport system component